MKNIINAIKTNEELSALLTDGVVVDLYSNEEGVLIKLSVSNEIENCEIVGSEILDKVTDIITSNSDLKLANGDILHSFNKYFRYMAEYKQ